MTVGLIREGGRQVVQVLAPKAETVPTGRSGPL